jgi:hypothetical protein
VIETEQSGTTKLIFSFYELKISKGSKFTFASLFVLIPYNPHGPKPTTNNETKDTNNVGIEWAPQALHPLVSCL